MRLPDGTVHRIVQRAVPRRSNRAQLDFSGMGRAATYGTARNVNAPVEIAGFDFSGTARYRTVSERYLIRATRRPAEGC
jgi:hypothetical protein